MGDIKLAAALGFCLGIHKLVTALTVTFLTGGAAALVLTRLHIKKISEPIPYAPFMALGTIIAVFTEV